MITARKTKKWTLKVCGLLVAGTLLTACATQPDDQANDPLEGLNRTIFVFNEALDTWFLKPAATLYRGFLPPFIQKGVHNFLNNLSSPIVLVNDLLQGEMDRAGTTVSRFFVNSTVGVLGFGDPASDMGMKPHKEDFGQTLAVWGTGEGPYIVLPIFGPSSPRDTVGLVVDYFADPINWWARNTDRDGIPLARGVAGAIDARATNYDAIEDLRRSSLDFYAAVRSAYRQRRADEIRNGEDAKNAPAPSVSYDFNSPAPGMEEGEELSETR